MNPTGFCQLVESRLGWNPPAGEPWRQYQTEAAKVTRLRSTNPHLYTWDNLKLAVELLAREKECRTPVGVFAHVDRALDLALDQEPATEREIRRVIAYEVARGDPEEWEGRFARTCGAHRAELLTEWRWNS